MPETAVANGHKTCKITLVNPGRSDSVIKVYPAEHEAEKIWLDNTQGIERWEMIKRMIYTDAEKGTRAPEPKPYHNDVKNLRTSDIEESDIPVVRLASQVLAKPKEEIRVPQPQAQTAHDLVKRLDGLESVITTLAASIATLATNSRSTQESKSVAEVASVKCDKCDKSFKNSNGLRLHGKAHK